MCDEGCHIKQTEPQTQYSNMGEGPVRELKKGVGRQIRQGETKPCVIRIGQM
jgi:hypothetical protein